MKENQRCKSKLWKAISGNHITYLIWFCLGYVGVEIILNIINQKPTKDTFSLVLAMTILVFLSIISRKV